MRKRRWRKNLHKPCQAGEERKPRPYLQLLLHVPLPPTKHFPQLGYARNSASGDVERSLLLFLLMSSSSSSAPVWKLTCVSCDGVDLRSPPPSLGVSGIASMPYKSVLTKQGSHERGRRREEEGRFLGSRMTHCEMGFLPSEASDGRAACHHLPSFFFSVW